MIELISLVGAHSITVSELKKLLFTLYSNEKSKSSTAATASSQPNYDLKHHMTVLLLRAMSNMSLSRDSEGPHPFSFFDFDGKKSVSVFFYFLLSLLLF